MELSFHTVNLVQPIVPAVPLQDAHSVLLPLFFIMDNALLLAQ